MAPSIFLVCPPQCVSIPRNIQTSITQVCAAEEGQARGADSAMLAGSLAAHTTKLIGTAAGRHRSGRHGQATRYWAVESGLAHSLLSAPAEEEAAGAPGRPPLSLALLPPVQVPVLLTRLTPTLWLALQQHCEHVLEPVYLWLTDQQGVVAVQPQPPLVQPTSRALVAEPAVEAAPASAPPTTRRRSWLAAKSLRLGLTMPQSRRQRWLTLVAGNPFRPKPATVAQERAHLDDLVTRTVGHCQGDCIEAGHLSNILLAMRPEPLVQLAGQPWSAVQSQVRVREAVVDALMGDAHRISVATLHVRLLRATTVPAAALPARVARCRVLSPEVRQAAAQRAFATFDLDKNDVVDVHELRALMSRLDDPIGLAEAKALVRRLGRRTGDVRGITFADWFGWWFPPNENPSESVTLHGSSKDEVLRAFWKLAQDRDRRARLDPVLRPFGRSVQQVADRNMRRRQAAALKAFARFDADGNGSLDRQELRQLTVALGAPLSAEALDRLYTVLDSDGNGTIDRDEFVTWWCTDMRAGSRLDSPLVASSALYRALSGTQASAARTEAAQAFARYDLDDSGDITLSEFRRLAADANFSMSEDELTHAFAVLDADDSGAIDFAEFWAWWSDDVMRSRGEGGIAAKLANLVRYRGDLGASSGSNVEWAKLPGLEDGQRKKKKKKSGAKRRKSMA